MTEKNVPAVDDYVEWQRCGFRSFFGIALEIFSGVNFSSQLIC